VSIHVFAVARDQYVYGTSQPGGLWVRIGHGSFTFGTPIIAVRDSRDNEPNINLFGVGMNGRVFTTGADDGLQVPTEWYSIGSGQFDQLTPLAGVIVDDYSLYLSGVGMDGAVYQVVRGNGAWSFDWKVIGEGRFGRRTPLAAVSRSADFHRTGISLDLFAVGLPEVGQYGRAWQWTDSLHGRSDGSWAPIQAGFFSQLTPITALARTANHLDLFAVGLDNQIWSTTWDANAGATWSDWFAIGGSFTQLSPITAISRYDRTVDLFGVGTDGSVYHASWDIANQGWTWNGRVSNDTFPPGTPLTAVSQYADDLNLFAVNGDGLVTAIRWMGGDSWTSWAPIAGVRFPSRTVLAAVNQYV